MSDKPEKRRRVTLDPSILETPPSNGSEWRVLMALGLHHNWKERAAWPSLRTLAEETGQNKGTVSRAITGLEELGLLHKITRRGRRAYRLPVDPRNRILGGPDRWKYIDQAVADSQLGVSDSQQKVADSQLQGCEMTTPSETGAPVPNIYKNNRLNITTGALSDGGSYNDADDQLEERQGEEQQGKDQNTRRLPQSYESWQIQQGGDGGNSTPPGR